MGSLVSWLVLNLINKTLVANNILSDVGWYPNPKGLWVDIIELLMTIIYAMLYQAQVFVIVSHFQPSIIFTGKALVSPKVDMPSFVGGLWQCKVN